MEKPKQPESNGLAVASLVLGILSLTGFSILAAIPAIITGGLALKSPVAKGMSIAGIIMGIVSTILTVLVILFFLLLGFAFSVPFDDYPGPYEEPYSEPTEPRLYQQRA
jgi:hypothetical protein